MLHLGLERDIGVHAEVGDVVIEHGDHHGEPIVRAPEDGFA
jgi:hypothetical protein